MPEPQRKISLEGVGPEAGQHDPFCGAEQPVDGGGPGYVCTAVPGHHPADHAAWDDGLLLARWPVASHA